MVIYKRKRNISLNYFGGTQKDDSISENDRILTFGFVDHHGLSWTVTAFNQPL